MAQSAILELLPAWELPAAEIGPPPAAAPRVTMRARAWQELDNAEEGARWDALALWASEPNPFAERWFMLPALRAFDPDGQVSLLCLEADGQLAGLLPIHRASGYYGHPLPHWRNWLHANAFLGAPLVAKGLETLFWRELLAWADGNAGAALFLHLACLAEHSPLDRALQRVLGGGPRQASTVLRRERAMLRSGMQPTAYLESALSAKKRKELRRQHRRLAELGEVTFERTSAPKAVPAWADEFLALECAGWKGEAGSAMACQPATIALFREALAGAAARGQLELRSLRLDGRPLAMLASFVCPPAVYSFKTAFDERYARFSPGVLLQCDNLDLLERPGIEWADSCAEADHPMIDHMWRERRTIVHYNVAIGGAARRLLFRAIAAREGAAAAR